MIDHSFLMRKSIGIKLKKSEHYRYRLLWSSSIKDESLYYSYLTLIYIFTALVLMYIVIAYTYSATIDHRLYDQSVLIISKIGRAFRFLGWLSIAWFIIRKPRGFQRKITIFAIILFILSNIISGSKLGLISAIMPFIFAYYAARMPIPRDRKRLFMYILVVSILIYPLFSSLRTFLMEILVSNSTEVFAVIEDMPVDMFPDRHWGPGNNPKTAVWEYLKTHPEFEIDKSIQHKLLITVAPDGYLRRVG